MNLEDYIKGERYGQGAYQLELEAMNDPFLQDAIDGYDLENDHPSYHLKKLRQQIKKRTRKNFHFTQFWSITAGAVIIICVAVLFFMLDSDKNIFPETEAYVENQTNDSEIQNNSIDNPKGTKSTQQATVATPVPGNTKNTPKKDADATDRRGNSYESNETPPTQPKKINKEEIVRTPTRNESSGHTLSSSEAQKLSSIFNNDKTNTLNQTPKPVGGDKAYSDYIKKNRLPLADDAAEKHGKVILLFKVNENGRPIDISILRPLCQAADREAIRLLQNGPNWTPSNNRARLEIDF